ncbi:MAG TPA: adenylate kinase [bacterium]|nr:adenylate kinase [bacterium]HOG38070.1 adenylate kinase [bacterium]HQI03126.1 adenylate kinase [bacterium]
MNIVFIGMPGSGKGTQAQKLAQKLNYPFVSTGDLFRSQIEKQTEIGKKAKQIIDGGNLVDDDVTFELLKQGLKDFDISRGLILDGFPRNLNQAKMLDEYLKIDKVININLSESEVLTRIGGRRTCICGATYHIKFNPPKQKNICDVCGKELFIREDAKEEAIKTRIEIYNKSVDPLLDFYRKKGLVLDIDGNPPIDEVTTEINNKLSL